MKKTTKLVVGGKETELKDEQLVNGVYKIPIEICFNNSEDDCIRTAYNFTLNEEIIQSEEEVTQPEEISGDQEEALVEEVELNIIGKCGDVSDQVVVHVLENGEEIPDIDCTDQEQVCQEYINDENKQDARCVSMQ